VDVDRDDVVEIGQRQFRHFVIPGKYLAAMKFCPGFARGWSHACRKGFNKTGSPWKGADVIVCKRGMVFSASK
jgi:3-isopropylmalate dehydratase small subunit